MYKILCLHLVGICSLQEIWKWVGADYHGWQKELHSTPHQQNWAIWNTEGFGASPRFLPCAGTCPWNHVFCRGIHRTPISVLTTNHLIPVLCSTLEVLVAKFENVKEVTGKGRARMPLMTRTPKINNKEWDEYAKTMSFLMLKYYKLVPQLLNGRTCKMPVNSLIWFLITSLTEEQQG